MAPVHFLPRPLQPLQRAEAQRQPLQAVARATELATDPVPGRKTKGFPRGKPGEKDGKGQKPDGKQENNGKTRGNHGMSGLKLIGSRMNGSHV